MRAFSCVSTSTKENEMCAFLPSYLQPCLTGWKHDQVRQLGAVSFLPNVILTGLEHEAASDEGLGIGPGVEWG